MTEGSKEFFVRCKRTYVLKKYNEVINVSYKFGLRNLIHFQSGLKESFLTKGSIPANPMKLGHSFLCYLICSFFDAF